MSRYSIIKVLFAFLYVFVIFFNTIYAQTDEPKHSQSDTTYEITKMKDQISEIRRDQLNYRIEKDILKEMYSTSVSTMNYILTAILVIFALIGAVGLRNITIYRKEIGQEIESVRNLRIEFETKIMEIEESQSKAKNSQIELQKEHDEVNKKIQLLELTDRIQNALKIPNYTQALEIIEIALKLEPDSISLLENKAKCFFRQKLWREAIEVNNRILEIDPRNDSASINNAELLLFTSKITEFNKLYGLFKSNFEDHSKGLTIKYFEALKYYVSNDYNGLVNIGKEFSGIVGPGQEKWTNWNFKDVRNFLKTQEDNKIRHSFLNLIDMMEGKISVEQFKETLPNSEKD